MHKRALASGNHWGGLSISYSFGGLGITAVGGTPPPGLHFLDSFWVLVLGSILCVGFGVDF